MTTPLQTPITAHSGNGATTVFAYTWLIDDSSEMVAVVDGITKTLGVDYTVSGVGSSTGGNVTFTAAPAAGVRNVVLYRSTPIARLLIQYQTSGDLLASVVNSDFDRIYRILQDLSSVFSARSLRAPLGETLTELPAATTRANKLLAFSASGDAITAGPSSGSTAALALQLANATTASEGAGMVGFGRSVAYQSGTVGAKLREVVSVEDFGAVGTGLVSDSTVINAALSSGARYVRAGGTYLISASLLLPDNVVFDCRGAVFLAASNGLTLIKNAATSSYYSQIWGGVWDGNGRTGVVAMDFNNMRINAGIFNARWKDCETGLISRNGMFGTVILNPGSERVKYPVQVLANASTMAIINPSFDNSPSFGGDGTGIGVDIRAGAGDNIGVRIDGGYIQGFTQGVKDAGIKTLVNDLYVELNTYDIDGVGARASKYDGVHFYGPSGTAGVRLRNCDAVTVFDPTMASGSRTGLFDVDNTNTNCRAHMVGSNASLNIPLGTTTGIHLTDYSAGFTVTDASGAGLTLTQNKQAYRSGEGVRVSIDVDITYPTTASTAAAAIALPVAARSGVAVSGACGFTSYGSAVFIDGSGSSVNFYTAAGAALTNANLSGRRLVFTLTYLVQ